MVGIRVLAVRTTYALLHAHATRTSSLHLAATRSIFAFRVRMAWSLAAMVAMQAPCSTWPNARRTVSCVALRSTAMPARQAKATCLATGNRADVTTLVTHFAVSPKTHPADELTAYRVISEVALRMTCVTAFQCCVTGTVAGWRRHATPHRRRQALCTTGAGKRLV